MTSQEYNIEKRIDLNNYIANLTAMVEGGVNARIKRDAAAELPKARAELARLELKAKMKGWS